MDIREILMQLQKGASQRQIAEGMEINRRTVKKYKEWAEEHQLLSGELPPLEELQGLMEQTMPETEAPQNVSSVEPYRAKVSSG